MKCRPNIYILGLKALQRASVKMAENAKKNNYKISVWENGKIHYEIPGITTEQAKVSEVVDHAINLIKTGRKY